MQDIKADRYCTLVYSNDDMFHILWMCMQDTKAGTIPAIYCTNSINNDDMSNFECRMSRRTDIVPTVYNDNAIFHILCRMSRQAPFP